MIRRRGKELRERALAALVLMVASPLFAACALAIKLEGLLDPSAAGPIFLSERRISRGRVFALLKFRTINAEAVANLSPESHIAIFEIKGAWTRVGRLLHTWYLDELPQFWNIVRGDMFLIGTRPYPVTLYEKELAKGITRKRDMPAGLIGPVQSRKGDPNRPQGLDLDAEYWKAFQTCSAWELFAIDVRIILRSVKVQLEHKGL